MRAWLRAFVSGAGLMCAAAQSEAQPTAGGLKLDRVVMLMRHGVRPPTSAQPIPKIYSADAWPTDWGVDYGLLTEHGAVGAARLGEGDRVYFVHNGLLPRQGCPSTGTISIRASNKQRAIRTAAEWARTLVPNCTTLVEKPADGSADTVFHGLDDKPAWFDGYRALKEAEAMAPPGGIAQEVRNHAAEIALLAKVLNCTAPACDLSAASSELKEVPHDRPALTGVLELASTASQSLLLEYLQGMPMKDVGWGRVSRSEIERLLVFHPIKFTYNNRPPYIAQAAAAPLMKQMLDALNASGSAGRITLLAGHDTNIADVGGLLRLHWQVPSYPQDDVPPGSAVGFEVWRDGGGKRFVRAFYRAQTMDQLRELAPLTGAQGPYRAYLDIPDCGKAAVARSCTLDGFNALAKGRLEAR